MKHTPRPWASDFNGKGTWTVFGPSKPVCYVSRIASEIKSQHDASLIAAAPDLLEACRGMVEIVSLYRERVMKGEIAGKLIENDYDRYIAAINAIAKAEGGE